MVGALVADRDGTYGRRQGPRRNAATNRQSCRHKWHADGYKDATPLGPASRASRQRANAGQSADQNKTADQSDTSTDQAQAAAANAPAKTAEVEAASTEPASSNDAQKGVGTAPDPALATKHCRRPTQLVIITCQQGATGRTQSDVVLPELGGPEAIGLSPSGEGSDQ
jgi:hypothetical protein